MANRRISMTKIRQVLRCYAAGKGSKSISAMLGLSRTTVKKYIHQFQKSDKTYEEIMEMDQETLMRLFDENPERRRQDQAVSARRQELEALLPEYVRRLKKRGWTRERLYREYCEKSPHPYGRSQFQALFKRYIIMSHPVAHIEHKAGDKIFVDYAGDRLRLLCDKESGEMIPTEVFVAILPCSQLTYVEAEMSQKKEDFIRGCENALRFYGGTPAAIVTDNLKSAVTRHRKYESELNEDFASFAEHHGCAVMPARVRRPRDKALVEDAVKLVYQNIYTRLEGQVFYDLESLNRAIWVALEVHNNTPMTGGRPSRRHQFEEYERECLGRLNPIRFELKLRHTATVQNNGYVSLEKSFYSVPYKYIGMKVNVLYDSRTVSIYSSRSELLAVHPRSYRMFDYVKKEEHLPANQRRMLTWNPETLLQDASSMHPDLRLYMDRVIEEKKYPEQAYSSCRGIMSLARKVGVERLLKACRLASASGMYNYTAVADILRNRQDELVEEELSEVGDVTTPDHENVRGKEYYK